MTVSQALEKIEPDEQIRIGCRYGHGFVYIGRRDGIDYDAINKASMGRIERLADKTANGCDRVYRQEMERRLTGWKQVQDREIIEITTGIMEPSFVLITEGNDFGEQYSFETTSTEYDKKACEALVLQIYKAMCAELVKLIKKRNRTPNQEEEYLLIQDKIMLDKYGLLSDPYAILKACKKRANNPHMLRPVTGNRKSEEIKRIIPEKGQELKARITAEGFRQADVAKIVGISKGNLSNKLNKQMDKEFYQSVSDAIDILVKEREEIQCV